MISYELAKKLKQSGFPQTGSVIVSPIINGYPEEAPYDVTYPTLPELIEACGDEFKGILRNVLKGIVGEKWVASNMAENLFATGSTPEEAVANLYLELNKK